VRRIEHYCSDVRCYMLALPYFNRRARIFPNPYHTREATACHSTLPTETGCQKIPPGRQAFSALSRSHRENATGHVRNRPHACRTGNQQDRIPDPVTDGSARTGDGAPIEEPDVRISDQHEAGHVNPEDPVGRTKKAAPILKDEQDGEGENNVAKEHPPESGQKPQRCALPIFDLTTGRRHKPSPNNRNSD